MSFADNPPPKYVPWKPNEDFVKFFEDMKKRRITSRRGDDGGIKVTDKPVGSVKRNGNRRQKAVKVNYSSISERLVNTAEAQSRWNKGGKKSPPAKLNIRRDKTIKGRTPLERKIEKHKF